MSDLYDPGNEVPPDLIQQLENLVINPKEVKMDDKSLWHMAALALLSVKDVSMLKNNPNIPSGLYEAVFRLAICWCCMGVANKDIRINSVFGARLCQDCATKARRVTHLYYGTKCEVCHFRTLPVAERGQWRFRTAAGCMWRMCSRCVNTVELLGWKVTQELGSAEVEHAINRNMRSGEM